MEEGKAAAVSRIEAAAQVIPTLDLMHRFVGDDLLEDRGGRLPVDAAQHQEAPVEPGIKEMAQVDIDHIQRGVLWEHAQQVSPHGHDFACGARGEVEPAEKLLPRTFYCRLKFRQPLRRWV